MRVAFAVRRNKVAVVEPAADDEEGMGGSLGFMYRPSLRVCAPCAACVNVCMYVVALRRVYIRGIYRSVAEQRVP